MTDRDDDLRLAELLCARLCHDLAGPVGAAVAGAELLEDDAPPEPEVVRMLAASIAGASGMLKVLRAALGHGTAPMPAEELRRLVATALPADGKVRLEWRGAAPAHWPRPWAKLILNLALIARDSLPRGGTAALAAETDPPAVSLSLSGPALAAGELEAALAAQSPETLTPRAAQAYYTGRLAAELAAPLTMESGDGTLSLRTVSSEGLRT